ncbi:unnamed protein product [Amoebophrya sp. A120]|nr:unnamed protein product [Amoebophrya sp. A120]|eukprot:GSA120T00018923001.1
MNMVLDILDSGAYSTLLLTTVAIAVLLDFLVNRAELVLALESRRNIKGGDSSPTTRTRTSEDDHVTQGDVLDRNDEKPEDRKERPVKEFQTSLVELSHLSALTGRRIFAKCEYENPGESLKDRVANRLVAECLRKGKTSLYEGTSGSTGVSLAKLCHEKNLECHLYVPDDCEKEKLNLMRQYNATVHLCKPTSYSSPEQYSQVCMRACKKAGAYFCDQFENEVNWRDHYTETGPEIWEQAKNLVRRERDENRIAIPFDAFVMSAGTGGTIAGCGRYFKEQSNNQTKVILADPPGSSLQFKVQTNLCYNPEVEREGHRQQRIDDTIMEGFGLNRITKNFQKALPFVDDAVSVSDEDAVLLCHYLRYVENHFCGSSSGAHLVACLHAAAQLPENAVICTVLCDSGERYRNRFWNHEVLKERGLLPPVFDVGESADVEVDTEKLSSLVQQKFEAIFARTVHS